MTAEPTTTTRTAPTPIMEVDQVSRWYGNVVAVNDITLSLSAGITGLLGPNGAGKSTLLHMLAGFLKPSSGEVRILGEPAWQNPDLYRRVGIVQEQEAVYDFLTGFQFVRLSAQLQGLPDPDGAARHAIEQVEMTFAASRKTGGYSKGMKQRIKIAAAMVHEPDVLLLDEPFNGADPRQRLQMIEMFRELAVSGTCILFSSHILEEMEQLGENVLVMVAGRLAASGDFRAIRRLLSDRPHSFTLRASDVRGLAGALIGAECVTSVEVLDGALHVRTSDYGRFTFEAPRLAQAGGITVTEIVPMDDSIESVFEYLAEGRG